MTSDAIQNILKVMGKIIQLSSLSESQSRSLKTLSVAFSKQQGGGDYTSYDSLTAAVIPLQQQIASAIAQLDAMDPATTQGMTNYLGSLVDDLGMTASGTLSSAQILSAIDSALASNNLYVVPSGQYWAYFQQTFNFGFPLTTRVTPIPDAWITTNIV